MTRTPEEIAQLPYRKNVGVMLVNSDDRVFVGRRIDMKGPHSVQAPTSKSGLLGLLTQAQW